jgi:hypothetical protein
MSRITGYAYDAATYCADCARALDIDEEPEAEPITFEMPPGLPYHQWWTAPGPSCTSGRCGHSRIELAQVLVEDGEGRPVPVSQSLYETEGEDAALESATY